MINQAERTHVVIRPDTVATTLRVIGDVRAVLRASCAWRPSPAAGAEVGNIAPIRLPDGRMRFGLGAAAFGPFPELAVQRLGECVLLEGVPWWTPAERMSLSRREEKGAELLTPFLIEWDTMNSAWGWLDSTSPLSLLKWYEDLLLHPVIGKTGAIAVEIVAQIPAGMIVDKYMCRAPLIHNNTLAGGQLVTDPDLIDVYFSRNTVRHMVPPETVCTVVMVGVVINPAVVTTIWGEDIVLRGFYTLPDNQMHSHVMQHTHAVVAFDASLVEDGFHGPLLAQDDAITTIVQELAEGKHTAHITHIEGDTPLNQAVARIGIIEKVEIKEPVVSFRPRRDHRISLTFRESSCIPCNYSEGPCRLPKEERFAKVGV